MAEVINIIELDQKWTNCTLCDVETPLGYSVAMYEGKIVDATKTNEWAGMPVCKECYEGVKLNTIPR